MNILLFLKTKHRKTKRMHKQGFTLIEALVAASILAVTLTALMNVMAQNVFNASYTKNKTVATLLAQEGVELVRNIQDSVLLDTPFDDVGNFGSYLIQNSSLAPCLIGDDCYIDPLNLDVLPCGGECPNLRLSFDGFYDYEELGTETIFRRVISLEPITQGVVRVTVEVFWSQGQTEAGVDYQMDLFPWI
jgi:prepilin-type N-terminal cleavage/methylation domain-containing protein